MSNANEKLLKFLPAEEELEEEFLRSASGPGGQNVNKTASAVRLTFRFQNSPTLSERVKIRLSELCGGADFVAFLARESRNMPDNREAARMRLASLIATASKEQKKRKKTKPTHASKQRRLDGKARRAEVKKSRQKIT